MPARRTEKGAAAGDFAHSKKRPRRSPRLQTRIHREEKSPVRDCITVAPYVSKEEDPARPESATDPKNPPSIDHQVQSLPAELRLQIYHHIVTQHHDSTPLTQNYHHSKLRRFLAHPQDLAVIRGVWDPSWDTPSFLPPICHINASMRLAIGPAWIASTNFVLVSAMDDRGEEFTWLRAFLESFSLAGGKTGYTYVRALSLPNFSEPWRGCGMGFVVDCCPLRRLTLGITAENIMVDGRLSTAGVGLLDVDKWITRKELHLLFDVRIERIVLVLGVGYLLASEKADTMVAVREWVGRMARRLKRRFLEVGKGVKIFLDLDVEWGRGESREVSEVEVDVGE